MLKQRFQNIGLWLAFASLVYLILQDAGITLSNERYQTYVDLISQILILLGIINNPTTQNKWFGDDTNQNKEVSNG